MFSTRSRKEALETPDSNPRKREEFKKRVQQRGTERQKVVDFETWARLTHGASGSLTCLCMDPHCFMAQKITKAWYQNSWQSWTPGQST